jgi:dihydroceramidase
MIATVFWEQFGTLSTVDWCEPNYIWSTYVAEWWNATTSLLLAVAGLCGLWNCIRAKEKLEARFYLVFIGLFGIGIGSAAFHGTLLRISQALDELPMIWLSLVYLYCLALRDDFRLSPDAARRKRWIWGAGCTLYGLGFALAYAFAESYFGLFLLSYGLMATFIILRSFYLTFQAPRSSTLERIGWISFLSFVGGLSLLWVPEHVLLDCDHPFQTFHPHSGWHLTSSIGAYLWGLWSIADRIRIQNRPVVIKFKLTGPFVE